MQLSEYQQRAIQTDHTSTKFDQAADRGKVIALLGLAGEMGSLATIYKKYLRDGLAYRLHKSGIQEELGDVLWYLAALAHKFDLSLDDVAKANLEKIQGRWRDAINSAPCFDKKFRSSERIPRKFEIAMTEELVEGRYKAVMRFQGKTLGDPLTDNANEPDGYRFHDAFHLAFLAVTGWSPVIRSLMKRQRRSDKTVDENEDGGRAKVIEEGIAALVFEYGSDNKLSADQAIVDDEFLLTLKLMTRRLEVHSLPALQWQKAVLAGWNIFNQLNKWRAGLICCNLDKQSIEVLELNSTMKAKPTKKVQGKAVIRKKPASVKRHQEKSRQLRTKRAKGV